MIDKELYKSTVKSNSLFGGIKFFQIIVAMARFKIVALILGPEGMGVQSLLTSTLDSLQQFTTFGIFQSSVRDISQANSSDNEKKIKILGVIKSLMIIVGVFGFFVCISFSSLLSSVVFGKKDYTIDFIVISVALIFMALSNGYIAILQGLRRLSELGKGSLVGAIFSIVISTPLYFVWGVTAIPYAIVIGYVAIFLVYQFYSRKIPFLNIGNYATYSEFISIGIPIVKLGSVLMLSNGIMTLFTLALNTFVNRHGSTADVGFFSAAVTSTYGNIIILTSILSSDYYPRLSASLDNYDMLNKIVNQQVELIILIVAPIICLIIPFAYYIVIILYSREFVVIIPMIQLMSLSLIFKVIWHSLSFIILAFGDRKTYLIYDAIIGNGLIFLLNIIGYKYQGLYGLSISLVVGSVIMVIILYSIISMKYQISLSIGFWKIFMFMLSMCLSSFCISLLFESKLTMMVTQTCVLLSTVAMSVYVLNKRINLLS